MFEMDKKALLDCWVMFSRAHEITVDRLVCDPKLRDEFVAHAARVCGSSDEEEILWALMGLRKQKKIPTK